MPCQFVRSLILAAVLRTADAGPGKPSGTTTAVSEATIETSTSVVSSVKTESAWFTSTTEALASTTEETTIATTIDIQTTTSGPPIESSMSNSEAETPTATSAGDITTTTEATTTTSSASTCIENKLTPPPQRRICGLTGSRVTNYGDLKLDNTPACFCDVDDAEPTP